MQDILIPLGLIAFLGLFVFAFISTARKQRNEKAAVFSDFARVKELRYAVADDGTAQRFARDLDGLGHFKSPSLGDRIPTDVVSGVVSGMSVVLFRHATRFYEGYSREWLVAGVSADASIAERCSLQFFESAVTTDSLYLHDPIAKQGRHGRFHLLVRAPTRASAGRTLDDDVLSRLSDSAGDLPFAPEMQIRANRVAVYPAERNTAIENAQDLQRLLDLATLAATSG